MIIVLSIIGYIVIGFLVLAIVKKLDTHYRMNLWKNFKTKEAIPEDAIYWSSGNDALDEYHRRTQWLPKKREDVTNPIILTMGVVLCIATMIIWPVAAIVYPIYYTIIYHQILKKAES